VRKERVMSEERRKILDLLAAGKISADDAERLLERVSTGGRSAGGAARADATTGGERPDGAAESTGFVMVTDRPRTVEKHRLKWLRVVVNSAKDEKVNIRIPLAFVRTGLKLSTMLPPRAHKRLEAEGIDLSYLKGLEGEELIEALRDLRIDVDSESGDTVRIFCE